jgi:hypothetical protein
MARSYTNPVVRSLLSTTTRIGDTLIAQGVEMGALPPLYAAAHPGVRGGDYIGPRGVGGMWGYPAKTHPVRPALSEQQGAALWDLTAKSTGVTPDPV